MKLPDFIKSEVFNRLRSSMGAELIENFSVSISSILTIADLEEMATSGKDIDLKELRVLEDGTLAYKDSRVLLHIRDIGLYSNRDPEDSLPKFHLADCDTLRKMKENKRFDRYVVSIRTDGKFDLNFIRHNKERRELRTLQVCMNCIDHLSYKGCSRDNYSEKRRIRDSFSIDEYFSIYPRSLFSQKPKHTSADAPINKYGPNWSATSTETKKNFGYRCQKDGCGVDLSAPHHQKYLEVHHKDAAKNNSDPSNLEVVCIYCHAEEFQHAHVKNQQRYKEFLSLRPSLLPPSPHKREISNKQEALVTPSITPAQKTQPTSQEDAFGAVRILAKSHNLEIEDFRPKNGAFWVNHDKKSDNIGSALSKLGFQYHAGRGWWKK